MTAAAPVDCRALTARDVAGALFGHFTRQGYAVLTEIEARPAVPFVEALRQGDLLADDADLADLEQLHEDTKQRRVDVLALRKPRKAGIGSVESLAVEVKVTRADFLNDVRNPAKQARWRDLTHRMAYAAPAGLIAADEVPEGCGLIEVHADHARLSCAWTVRAPYGDHAPDLPPWLALTFAHRLAWAEGRQKGLAGPLGADDDPEHLRAEITRLTADLDRARRATERERGLHLGWKEAYAVAGGLPCKFCAEPVAPRVRSGFGITEWRHRRKAADDPCLARRTALAEDNAKHVWAGHADRTDTYGVSAAHRRYPAEPWRYYLHLPDVMPDDDTAPPTEGDPPR